MVKSLSNSIVKLFTIICQIYTITYMDNVQRLICLSTMFMIPQACVEFIEYVENSRFFADQVQTLRRFYSECEASSHGQRIGHPEMQILKEWAKHFKTVSGLFAISDSIAALICFIYSIYVFMVDGHVVYALPMFIPGIGLATFSGVLVTSSYHSLLLCISALDLIGSDLLMVILILHLCTMSDVLCGNEFRANANCVFSNILLYYCFPGEDVLGVFAGNQANE